MSKIKRFVECLASVAVAGLASACASGQAAVAPPPPMLRHGINILGADPIWMSPERARFKLKYFKTIRDGGFDFVRVNAAAMRFVDPKTGIDPRYLATLDWVVKNAQAAGLSVIVDEHDNIFCGLNAVVCNAKLRVFWRQVATRYRGESNKVLFEILNEPHLQMNDGWNDTIADVIKIIRETNPTRTIVVGPKNSDNMNNLNDLVLPENDRNILVTFHYYDPHEFTHQGASWDYTRNIHGVTWGTKADRIVMANDFDRVAAWAQTHNRPILLGEFGVFEEGGTPMVQRTGYLSAITQLADERRFAWSYWQFDQGFVAYDVPHDRWLEPIRAALIKTR